MVPNCRLRLLSLSIALLGAGDPSWAGDQPWKDKRVAEWTQDDVQQVLTDSPWAKTVTPTVKKSANNGQRSGGGRGGRGGGGMGGIGIGLPGMGGMGGGRRGGMGGGYPGGGGGGYPGGGGGGYPGGQRGGTSDEGSANAGPPPALKLRWESALPIREAELKARDTNAPTVDDNFYAIAVYGVPSRMAGGDSRNPEDQLKKQAALKREGKKDLKPSRVQVLQRDDGAVIVYLFPRSTEISRSDKRLEFDAQIGRLQFAQSFYVDDMTYQGKLEL